MKPKYKKTVDAGDLIGTRISLADEMMLDPRGISFKEMRSYAEAAFSNLYEPHDGTSFDRNKAVWNESLLFAVRNDLDSNFSHERLDYYCQLAKVVLKDKAENLQREEERNASRTSNYGFAASSNNNEGRSHTTIKKNSDINSLYVSLAVGGILVGASGLVMGKAIIATIGLVSAAVGGGLIYNDMKK